MKVSFMSRAVALVAIGCLVAVIGAPAWAVSVSIPVGLTLNEDSDYTDDAEEQTVASDSASKVPGWVGTGSSDIEMGQEDPGGPGNCTEGTPCAAANPMIAGYRFLGIPIPQGTTITSASIQFTADEPDKNAFAANLKITGELVPDAATFVTSDDGVATFGISGRDRTLDTVAWTPDPWIAAGDSGPAQLTPDLSTLVQEIVDQPLWSAGNAMVFIVDGTRFDGFEGNRTVEPADGTIDSRAVLNLEFVPEPCALALALSGMVALIAGRRRR